MLTESTSSLMASMTTDVVLAVYDDGAGLREQTLKVSATSQEVMGTGSFQLGPSADGLSAYGGGRSTCSARLEQDSAADGSQQVLHTAPCVVLWAEAFTVIDADLEAFSPGRVAAHDVRGRAVIYIW